MHPGACRMRCVALSVIICLATYEMILISSQLFLSPQLVENGLIYLRHNVFGDSDLDILFAKVQEECRLSPQPHLDDNNRIKYYLGLWAHGAPSANVDTAICPDKGSLPPVDRAFCFNPQAMQAHAIKLGVSSLFGQTKNGFSAYLYTQEMVALLSKVAGGCCDGQPLPVQFGDGPSQSNLPVLIKVAKAERGLNSSNVLSHHVGVILPLAAWRHWIVIAHVAAIDQTPFEAKKDVAIWRGATTGPRHDYERRSWERVHQRPALVRRSPQWSNNAHIDIGVTKYVHNVLDRWGTVPSLSMRQMLDYKMLIVAEGNDVATSLKWMLMATSAVIMPRPTKASWLMEDMLVPWQHYIPVAQDFHDLPNKVDWCLKHLEACKTIGHNGHCFMQPFLDRDSESRIKAAVVKRVAAIAKAMNICRC